MKTNTVILPWVAVLALIGLAPTAAQAELPADFPEFTIIQNGDTAPGYLIGSVDSSNPEVGSYFMIMDNAGVPIFHSSTQSLGGMLCYDTRTIDMSEIVEGGHPAAQVVGAVIQELDVEKNVIFQWRSWDHIPILDTYQDPTKTKFDYIHVNSVELDETDGNILLSCRGTSEVIKISRVTGEVMWRMGGKNNEFTILNDHEENAPRYFKLMHDVRRHANGHLTMFDNGADKKDLDRTYSRAVEYDLDEESRTATMVWEYRNDPDILALSGGNVIRLPNGNTIVRWGGAAKAGEAPAMTEADPSGQLVYEITPADADVIGGFNRIIWPLEDLTTRVTHYELLEGNEYVFNDGDVITGVTLDVNTLDPEGYNEASVTREPFAPLYPVFAGKAPRLLPVRVAVSGFLIDGINAVISFDAASFGFADSSGQFGYANPTNLTIYHRDTIGQGEFVPLATDYNPVKGELRATMTGFGEFILGFPDLAEVANSPILIEPPDTVNQELPVTFVWTSRGFAVSNHLQVATDEGFTNLVLDTAWMRESHFTWPGAESSRTYYYRVKITNDGGDSDWATGSFQTVEPSIEVTAPNGGELWPIGLDCFIRWNDNIAEDVVIDLYKDGAMLRNIATNASTGVYEWEVDLDLEVGFDYSIKISSATDPALFDVSDQPFANGLPVVQPDTVVRLPNGDVQFDISAPGAAECTVWRATTLMPADWEVLSTVPLTEGSAQFTDDSTAGVPARYYRISVP